MEPSLYHAHHSRHSEDLPFWQYMAADRGSPILELGCGTGRVLLPLAAGGFSMVGLDHDSGMLAFLQQRLTGPDQPLIVQSDLRTFAFGIQFPLIILPCNTLTVLSAPDRRLLFNAVRRHLVLQGMFVASLPNPAILADLPPVGEPVVEEVFPHPGDGGDVRVSSAWERTAGQVTITWIYDRVRDDGSVENTVMSQSHNSIPLESLQAELEEAGLGLKQTFGDYDQSPYEPESPFCILVAARDH